MAIYCCPAALAGAPMSTKHSFGRIRRADSPHDDAGTRFDQWRVRLRRKQRNPNSAVPSNASEPGSETAMSCAPAFPEKDGNRKVGGEGEEVGGGADWVVGS